METRGDHWYPIASSREVGNRPVGLTRFGEKLVLWRGADNRIAVMHDRCPHRGAGLSLGEVKDGCLVCPFHGLAFATDGRCAKVPVEADPAFASEIAATALPCHEEHGYIWLWRGSSAPTDFTVPAHPELIGQNYGESVSTWPAHYTRCIENVCDFSHLAFVHKTTIGLFRSNTATVVDIEDVAGGFRAHLMNEGDRGQWLEFIYPNLWMLRVSRGNVMSAVFTPIDERSTRVYGRTWYQSSLPGLRPLMDLYTRFSQFLVFREDWPIVASQNPGDVDDVRDEKLFPSDAPVIAYRKLKRKAEGHAPNEGQEISNA